MSLAVFYGGAGAVVFCIALHGLIARPSLLRKLMALNIMSSGVFLVFIGLARRTVPSDPVPHAMVLTGIVVAVSAMAYALMLLRRLHAQGGLNEEGGFARDSGESRG